MAHQDKSDSEKQLVKGTRRRSILRAGLAMPLGSSALLVACGGGGSSDPLTPAANEAPSPAPAEPVVASAPVPVPVPPVEPLPAKRVQEGVKKVRILNFQTSTVPMPANQRLANEDMKTYTTRALQSKFELLRDALAEGLPKKTSPAEICYFVAPEFFWNVNWDAVTNEGDIKVFSETCVTEVKKHVRALISLFPQEQFGKLALLPGTAQVLIKRPDHKILSTTIFDTTDSGNFVILSNGNRKEIPLPVERVYEAFNYVLVIDNFTTANPDGVSTISMWPKRSVSKIDFPHSVELSNFAYWVPRLGKLDIIVLKVSTTDAASDAGGTLFTGFDNDPLGGVPFGVDVCLDYVHMYVDGKYTRMSQIENTSYVIDFLIASGMSIGPYHDYLPSVQYVIRNDGANHNFGLGCEVFRLSAPKSKDKPGPRDLHKRIGQTVVASPRGSQHTLFDSYFDIHPNASDDAPTVIDDLPSPTALS